MWINWSVGITSRKGGSGILIEQNGMIEISEAFPEGFAYETYSAELLDIMNILKILRNANLSNNKEIRICTDSVVSLENVRRTDMLKTMYQEIL